MKLSSLRTKIDKIDRQIVELLNARSDIALAIGRAKLNSGSAIFAPDREKEVYEKINKANKGVLTKDALKSIYTEIMSAARGLSKKSMVAYLGPAFTFTHIAAMKKFGSQVEFAPCENISDIFSEVEKSRCDYGVVPVENSFEGVVSHTLDMFIESDLKICAELLLKVEHNLLSKTGLLKNIKKVYSNPMVFGQCRRWLESNLPRVNIVSVSSTTRAALLAAKEKNSAAIASDLAAKHYGLKILARAIEDSHYNVTRFLVISKYQTPPSREDKTSIMFSIKDKVGALHDILLPFKRAKINMTKIESRPSKRKAWEYYFFVDFVGHTHNKPVMKALNQLKKECNQLKILGSYPVCEE